MIAHLTPAGAIHVVLAMLCLLVGFIQFLRPKRGAAHRARGYFYVYAMLVLDAATLLVYRFTGQFNAFHVAAIVNFTLIVLAIVPLLCNPRSANWRTTHYYFIAWSYPSLISAGVINVVARLVPLTTRGQVGLMALLVSIVITAIAYILIRKYRPASEATTMATGLVEQSGLPS